MTVLVTGATGFVGRALVTALAREARWTVRGASRRADDSATDTVRAPELDARADWSPALRGCTHVVHAAARVHVMRDTASDPLAEFRRVNVDGTRALAEQAAAAGVQRFVFVSSIKVNGEGTAPGTPFTSADPPAPRDPYGVSKWEAERALFEVSSRTGMEVAIVRPVLVYGPGVGANFRRLMQALDRGLPLPLGGLQNRRSLVALDNLSSVIARMLSHPAAAGRVFLASDDHDLSTTELLQRTARALGTSARLLPCPARLLRAVAGIAGQRDAVDRLLGTLQVDIRETKTLLEWTPPVSVDTALDATARAYRGSRT